MADENKAEAGDTSKQQEKSPEVISVEDFRKFQASTDRARSDLERQRRELEQRMKELEEQNAELVNTLADPEAKAQYQQKALTRELETYRRRVAIEDTAKWYNKEYGVPLNVMDGCDNENDVGIKALAYLKDSRAELERKLTEKERQTKVEELESSGATDVVPTKAPSPEVRQEQSNEDLVSSFKEKAIKTGKSTLAEFLMASRTGAKPKVPTPKV